ncbi:MAG: hypothetical protein JXQ72_07520 [Anaerolineae bacterium]|nr:hypothetical protein [Anaerolineae bacterium]
MTPDDPSDFDPLDDDSDEPEKSEEREPQDDSESPDESEDEDSADDMDSESEEEDDEPFEPVDSRDIGTPRDFKDEHIPSHRYLCEVADRGVREQRAFLILHQENDPQQIVDNIEKIADAARRASLLEGDHQARAIQLGLDLGLEYWLWANKIPEWGKLIMPLLRASLSIGNEELLIRAYHAWGIYSHLINVHAINFDQDKDTTSAAFESALRYAEESGREDLKLLVRAERFNVQVTKMMFDEARAAAQELLAKAKPINYYYIYGRVYFALARLCHYRGMFESMFAYAQLALVYFCGTGMDMRVFMGRSVNMMLSSFHPEDGHSTDYQRRLLDRLEKLAVDSGDPRFEAIVYHHRARQHLDDGGYDPAREYILKAWTKYRSIRLRSERVRVSHALGAIQIKRSALCMADRHLSAVLREYEKQGQTFWAIDVYVMRAVIIALAGDVSTACECFQDALARTEALSPGDARDKLIELIQAEIARFCGESGGT